MDSAVYRFMSDKYFEGRKPSEAEILEIYAPFGEWQALAYWFEFAQESWWPSLGLRL